MAASAFINVLILQADAGEIPANRATCRTPLPAARNCFAFSTFGLAIGGRPNLIVRLRAAAWPRRILSRLDCLRWWAINGATSSSDTPFEVAVSICCSCRYKATPPARQVSKNPTNSVRDRPTRHSDQTSTLSIEPLRIASISASSPERRSRSFFTAVGRSAKTCATVHPPLIATVVRCLICSSAVIGQSGLDRA